MAIKNDVTKHSLPKGKSPRSPVAKAGVETLSANKFMQRVHALSTAKEKEKIQKYFKSGAGDYGEGDIFIGIRMGQLFALAIEFEGMPIPEIEKLLESPIHEMRAGAVSLMDKESRSKRITEPRLKSFFELYMRRHDRINNWDLVDLGCLHMTGSYLYSKQRTILYKLARSKTCGKDERRSLVPVILFARETPLIPSSWQNCYSAILKT